MSLLHETFTHAVTAGCILYESKHVSLYWERIQQPPLSSWPLRTDYILRVTKCFMQPPKTGGQWTLDVHSPYSRQDVNPNSSDALTTPVISTQKCITSQHPPGVNCDAATHYT